MAQSELGPYIIMYVREVDRWLGSQAQVPSKG